MTQRVITALILAAVGVALLALGGVVMAAAIVLVICFAVYEEFHALSMAGHRPVTWPTWAGIVLSVPLLALGGDKLLIPIATAVCLLTLTCVIFRREPRLEDCLMSLLPLLSLVLPGMCAMKLALIEPHSLQVCMMLLMLAVPSVGDIFALFVGSSLKGPKLCPAVSPNKTISGAIGGLVGSLLTALLVGGLVWIFAGANRAFLPAWWHYVLLGVIGGAAGQIGDLFASMVKRHCRLKDFSNLFPGHGGMLDRMDSIIFMALVMFSYCLLTGVM